MLRELFLVLTRLFLLKKTSGFFFTQDEISIPENLKDVGLYLHIPFCRTICPFCPYNKILYDESLAIEYEAALIRELDLYKRVLGDTKFTSLYIGGGTPATMIDSLAHVISHAETIFGFGKEVGIELHPDDVTEEALRILKDIGVNSVSLGVQSFNDKLLKIIGRGYSGQTAEKALSRILKSGFKCVDVDLLFSLPTQTIEEVKSDLSKLFNLGVDQVSCYPLIVFAFSKMPKILKKKGLKVPNTFQEKRMLDEIIDLAEKFGYQRTSIWSFTKKGSSRYTSVTREFFVGIGASGSSRISGYFYLNTFSPKEYIKMTRERLPIALVAKLSQREEMGWWLFWRFYDTCIRKRRFRELFGININRAFGSLFRILNLLKITKEDGEYIRLTKTGAFLFQLVEQQYSLSYLNKTWKTLSKNPWPEKLKL